jgi:hypothetical protein
MIDARGRGYAAGVAQEGGTYETPPAGDSAVGLEEYVVEDAEGRVVGKVLELLDTRGDMKLVVERGTPPISRDRRAVPLRGVEDVDHSALRVRLKPNVDLDRAQELDPALAREGDAEARRVRDLPEDLTPPQSADAPRAGDRPLYLVTLGTAAAGFFLILTFGILISLVGTPWPFLILAAGLVLLGLSGRSAVRMWRAPYDRSRR